MKFSSHAADILGADGDGGVEGGCGQGGGEGLGAGGGEGGLGGGGWSIAGRRGGMLLYWFSLTVKRCSGLFLVYLKFLFFLPFEDFFCIHLFILGGGGGIAPPPRPPGPVSLAL